MAFRLDGSVGFLVNRTAIYLKRELQLEFRSHGHAATVEQWQLLNQLWETEGCYQVQLAELILKDKPNVGRMLAVLEKDGLIERRRDEQDQRAYRIYLKDEGKKLRNELVPLAMSVLKRALDGIGAEDIGHLKRILVSIDGNLGLPKPGTAN
jgi:DNA-binding MarR family transcriptional regulator